MTDFPTPSSGQNNGRRWALLRLGALVLVSATSLLVPKIALGAAFLTLLGCITRPSRAQLSPSLVWGLLGAAVVTSGAGTWRFLSSEAALGIVQGSKSSQAQSAISALRLIVAAEDTLRSKAWLDHDHDGIGSAGFIEEMTGYRALRNGQALSFPLLDGYRVKVHAGNTLASINGYLFRSCLPASGGGWTSDAASAVDEERAERQYWLYAWPESAAGGLKEAFAVDEHERIFVNGNADGMATSFRGIEQAPPCDAAATAPSDAWRSWRNKRARKTLPGDR